MANDPNNTQGAGADPQSQNSNQNDGNTGNAGEEKTMSFDESSVRIRIISLNLTEGL